MSSAAESSQDNNDGVNNSTGTSDADTIERKYWEQTLQIINASESYLISNEQLRLILTKIKKCQASVFEHTPEHEPFFTSLLTYCIYVLLSQLDSYTHDQVVELESICYILINYFLDYLKTYKANERTLSSYQVILLIEALLGGKADLFKDSTQMLNDYPGIDLLDLNTIVTILTSSKLPRFREPTTKSKNLVVKIKSDLIKSQPTMSQVFSDYQRDDYTIESLVTQFLNQNFNANDNTVNTTTNNSSSMVSQSQASKFSDRSSATNISAAAKISSSSKRLDHTCSFLTKSPKEVFFHYTRHCFHFQTGLEIIFSQLQDTAVNLVSFRTNYLDRLFSEAAETKVFTLPNEEALKISNKTQRLTGELKFFLRCLNWPVFKKIQMSPELTVKLGELVHAAQVAGLLTCLSELTLLSNASASSQTAETLVSPTNNLLDDLLASNESSLSFAKLSLTILDRFQVIVEQLNPSLSRNMSFKSSYILLQYLNVYLPTHSAYLQAQVDKRNKPVVTCDANKSLKIQSYSDAKFTASFDLYMTKLVGLLKQTLLDTKSNRVIASKVDTVVASISSFDVNETYANGDFIAMLNGAKSTELFQFVFESFQLIYWKFGLIDCVRKEVDEFDAKKFGEKNVNEGVIDSYKDAENFKTEIKNIDDPSTDEEPCANSNPGPKEESEDFLLLGSWFDDQLNAEPLTTVSGLLSSNTNATVESNILPALGINEKIGSEEFLSNGVDSSSATQILDTTFELEQSTCQPLGNVYLIVELIDLIVRLADKEPAGSGLMKSLTSSIGSKQIEEFSLMVKYIESNNHLCPESFTLAYYKFIQFIIVKGLLTTENQDKLLELLDMKSVNRLAINSRHLALKFQLRIFRLSSKDQNLASQAKEDILTDWRMFLASLESAIKQNQPTESNDVTMELMAYQLFLYYYLNSQQQAELFSTLASLLTELKSTLVAFLAKEQPSNYLPVMQVTRVLILFDYLMRNSEKPSQSLLLMVEAILLNINTSSDLYDLYTYEFTLNNFEKLLKNYTLFECDATPTACRKDPTFYSFTANKIADFNLKQQRGVSSATLLANNGDKLYEAILEISALCQSSSSYKSSCDHVSIGYNFLFAWAILDPVHGPFSPSTQFLTDTVKSLFRPDLTELNDLARFESNLKLAQLFRVAYKLTSTNGLDEECLNALRLISGGSTLDAPRIAFEFFHKFWSAKIASDSDGETAEEFALLRDNIELLNFHLKLLHEKFFTANFLINLNLSNEPETAQLRNSCIDLLARIIKAYKNCYKQFVLLKNVKQENDSLSPTDLEILKLITSASSLTQTLSSQTSILTPTLAHSVATPKRCFKNNVTKKLTRTNSTTTPVSLTSSTVNFQRSMSNESNKNANNLQVNTVVGELNAELKQINCLDSSTSCLISLSQLASLPALPLFQTFLTKSDAKAKSQHDLIRCDVAGEETSADDLLMQSVLCRCLNPELLFALVLSSLTHFLNEFLFSSAIESTLTDVDYKVFKQIESLFISLNGDLTCFKYLTRNVLRFFNSPLTVKIYSQQLKNNEFDIYFNNMSSKYKYECILLSNVSAHTYEVIYKLCTAYYLNGVEETVNPVYDGLFQELLEYVNKSLDSPYGIQGFCEFFASKSEVVQTSNSQQQQQQPASKSELIGNSNNKFLILFSTASKQNSSCAYFMKILTILNKLFRINFAYNHKLDAENTFHLKLSSILRQLNQLADLDPNYLHKWLAKLVIPKQANNEITTTTDQLDHKYTLKQMAIYLINEKNTLVGETVTLSILSGFIQSASKLINEHSSTGFPDLIMLMNTLSCAGSGLGHLYLFQACCIWLEYFSTLNIDQLASSKEYDILKLGANHQSNKESNPMAEDLVVKSACHILTYVCDVLDSLKGSNAYSSSQYLPMIDPSVNKEFNKMFKQSVFADFNQDFEKLVEFIQKSEMSANQTDLLMKTEKKKASGKRRLNGNRRSSSRSKDTLRSIDNDEELLNEQGMIVDSNYETNDHLDLDDFTEDDDHDENENEDNGDNANANDNQYEDDNDGTEDDYENYYDDDDDDDDEDDDDENNNNGDNSLQLQSNQTDTVTSINNNVTSSTANRQQDTESYDYFEDDDNFSDNPLAQSSTAAQQPVILGVNGDLTAAVTNAIRSSNTFNLNADDLFEEEGDYAEEEDDEDDDDEDDEDEDDVTNGQMISSDNVISRQSSSADVTNSLAANGTGDVINTNDNNTTTSNVEYFEVEREEEEEEEEDDDDDDDEYGDDFKDNFLADYENVDRRTLIKELVNASNALAASASKPANNLSTTGANSDLANYTSSSLSDTNNSRDAIYQDLMSTISAAASTISTRLQNQMSTSSTNSLNPTSAVEPTDTTTAKKDSDKTSGRATKTKSFDVDAMDPDQVGESEEQLNSKLCTFTTTKKEFMNQHWYYCHTCGMIDRIGMCTICAKVCHKGHDISYAKYGSFFCDCGAKEDGSCKALNKRPCSSKPNNNDSKKGIKATGSKLSRSKKKSESASSAVNVKFDSRSLSSKNFLANNIPTASTLELIKRINTAAIANRPRQLEKIRQQLIECVRSKDLVRTIRQLLNNVLLPMARKVYDSSLLNTNGLTARRLLAKLKRTDLVLPFGIGASDKDNAGESEIALSCPSIEQQPLFVVTLGSQEGAFENVRMTYSSGDHGPIIKQLIQSHSIRRTSMCYLASKSKKHLIVTHEKGKSSHFTILQLNALLKQDSNKRNKLTLTKLNTIPVPFTLISVAANHCNEDYIALTGLKDCYVMYLNENGQTKQELLQLQSQQQQQQTSTQQGANPTSGTTGSAQNTLNKGTLLPVIGPNNSGLIVLHPSLEGSNYIIKSIWLPNSKTELALVTSEFIKIYDLSIDKISPLYYYLLPMGKIKDVTFVYETRVHEVPAQASAYSTVAKYIVIMSSCGYLYYEEMNEVSSAKNGIYYVTNTIDVQYEQAKTTDTNEATGEPSSPATANTNVTTNTGFGDGISVYYSFKLGLLFWSFQFGKTFIGSFKDRSLVIDKVFSLTSNSSSSKGNNNVTQPLCNWNEIPTHPGLVMAMTYLSNNPVVLMLLPDRIYIQEIKLVNNQGGPSKAKIQDMVATRHQACISSAGASTGTVGTESTLVMPTGTETQANEDDDGLEMMGEDEVKKEQLLRMAGLPTINNEKTTMIILCDDGSLKIYVADKEKTEYWLQPHLKSTNAISQLKSGPMWSSTSLFQLCPLSIFDAFNKPEDSVVAASTSAQAEDTKDEEKSENNNSEEEVNKNSGLVKPKPLKRTNAIKKKTAKQLQQQQQLLQQQQQAEANMFPIDYFEKCSQLNEIEYSGNDLLEVYNQQQLKSRLSMGGNKYVCSTKPNGFTLEIRNSSDASRSLLVGCRILLGTHSLERVPTYFQVFSRRMPVKLQRQRWFDICLTREEAILADNFISIQVGPSSDTMRHVTLIDACVCYVKTKESLNWSKEEANHIQKRFLQRQQKLKNGHKTAPKTTALQSKQKSAKKSVAMATNNNMTASPTEKNQSLIQYKPKPFDCLLGQSLDLLENCIVLLKNLPTDANEAFPHSISIDLLSLLCPPVITYKAKSLLYNSLTLSSPSKENIQKEQQQNVPVTMGLAMLYNSYNDDALLSLISNTFQLKSIKLPADQSRYFNTFNSYLDELYDLETLEKTLVVCKSLIQQQRAHNLIKYLNDKFNMATNGQSHFITALNDLFWRVLNRHVLSLNQIGQPTEIPNLAAIIETLVEVMHTYLMVELTNVNEKQSSLEAFSNSTILNIVFDCYMKLLCNDLLLDINFTARKTLLLLLKVPSASARSKATMALMAAASAAANKGTPMIVKPVPGKFKLNAPMAQSSLTISELTNEPVAISSNQVIPIQRQQVDETVQFPIGTSAFTNQAAVGGEVAVPADAEMMTDESANNNFAPVVPENQQDGEHMAQDLYNEDEEILQLAMALSLKEAEAAAAQAAKQDQTPIPNPTETASLPKSSVEPSGTQVDTASLVYPTAHNFAQKLLQLRKILLDKFAQHIEASILDSFTRKEKPPGERSSGLRLVAFFQCILNLISDLSYQDEEDKKLLNNIIHSLLNILAPLKAVASKLSDLNDVTAMSLAANEATGATASEMPIYIRTEAHDLQLLVLRTVSILLSKSKYQRSGDTCNFIIQTLLQHLCQFNMIDVCQNLMKFIYFDYWKRMHVSDGLDTVDTSSLPQANGLLRFSDEARYYEELSPYFLKDPLNKDSFLIPAPDLLASSGVTQPQQSAQINLFDNYAELLTEILIRLPYQMKKLCLSSTSQGGLSEQGLNAQYQQSLAQITNMFEFSAWTHYLCEYLLLPHCYYLKRLIKKLLQILCGSKDKYRKFKDHHILITSMRSLVELCNMGASSPAPLSMLSMGSNINTATESLSMINESTDLGLLSVPSSVGIGMAQHVMPKLTYQSLLKLVDHLKVILEVASARTLNWQRFCAQNPSSILYLIELALLMGVDSNGTGSDSSSLSGGGSVSAASTSAIIPTILQILLCSLGGVKAKPQASSKSGTTATTVTTTTTTTTNQKTSKKTLFMSSNNNNNNRTITDENLCSSLVNLLFKTTSKDILYKFIRTYLLEAANQNIRWTLHTLLYNMYKNSSSANQELLYEILIQLWPDAMTTYGVKATQYVDLIGYILIKVSSSSSAQTYENPKIKDFLQQIIYLFQYQNLLLATHPNSTIYNTLAGLVPDFEGIYLEPDPCFICNSIEAPVVNFKLSNIKADSRYTTNQQIFKLNGTYLLSKVQIKISEIRKSKMVSAINVYYTNKSVHSIVDLKMNGKLWSKAKRVNVQMNQTEVKIDFQLPIIACNLMIEYVDFYDRDSQTNTETAILQCPRCSASVPAHPGVCNTCGENVFQCHKCRSINYDERDPFLCNSCGFCKFAKFDFTLVGRNCCAVDPIESEEDRKQTLLQISSLLERADKIYYTLSQHTKPTLESMIIKLNEQNVYEKFTATSPANTTDNNNPTTTVGKTIQQPNQQSTTAAAATGSTSTGSQQSTHANKTSQSIVQKYTVECKGKFDELSKIILKLNLCRKELREYDKQFKSETTASVNVTRKNSTALTDSNVLQSKLFQQQKSVTSSLMSLQGQKTPKSRSTCFGCASASIENCITLFRALLCSNNVVQAPGTVPSNLMIDYIKSELCRQGILEELINFNLKRHLLFGNPGLGLLQATAATSAATTAPAVPPTAAQVVASGKATTNPTAATSTVTGTTTTAQPSGSTTTAATAASSTNLIVNPINQRMHHRDIINLIFLLINDNPDGFERFQKIILNKIETFLTPIVNSTDENSVYSENSCLGVVSSLFQVSGGNAVNSPLKYELMLISALMQKQDDSCWEQRLRLVIHILLRSLDVAESSSSATVAKDGSNKATKKTYNNPILMECLTLPCLRILNHVCKTSTNLSLLSSMASSTGTKFNSSSQQQQQHQQQQIMSSILRPSLFQSNVSNNSPIGLNRFYSEPHDINYSQSAHPNLNNNYLSMTPGLNELDAQEFLQSNSQRSYYDKWLQLAHKNREQSVKQSEAKAATQQQQQVVEESSLKPPPSPQVLQAKAKYFAAWRKYTLKKRKQNQQLMKELQQQQANAVIESKIKPMPFKQQQTQPLVPPKESNIPQPTLAFDYSMTTKWLKQCLFCASSRPVRQLTCNILQSLFSFYAGTVTPASTSELKKFQLAELLAQFLDEGSSSGECFGEYLTLFKHVINDRECKYRLVLNNNVLSSIERLLHTEIKYLSDLEKLSELSSRSDRFSLLLNSPHATNLSYMSTSTNLNYGYSIKSLTELMAIFLKETNIKNKFKGRLIATVLNSYLSLKKLVYQRTKLIEEAQEKLLNILEQLTSGTEAETRKFMSICSNTVNNFELDDLVTPVFIFERLCNIIYPEEIVDNKEFLMILEKDPNQEDYLQGRMLGNPYSSNEPSLGPLMRNVKNKICTDCELIALLEDDNGMELLVNNKIISLDLPVRDVFKKVWLTEVLSEHDPMRVVYRMTGLSGDATEDIIDNLDAKGNDQTKDDEDIYRMANELATNGALDVMLERLASITQQNFTFGKPLLSVLMKLFDYALKLSINRQYIIRPELKTITTMLQTLNMMLKIEQTEPNKIGVHLAEQLLNIMECILSEASKQPADVYNEFSSLCGDTEQLEFLLNNIKCTFVRSHPQLLQGLMKLIPYISFGDEKKMHALISYFSTYYTNFDKFDNINLQTETTNEDVLHLECFCVIVNGIEIGEMGMRLRDMMHEGGVSLKSVEYLLRQSPEITTYLNSDFDLWKPFINRNSLPYVLRILTGLCRSHEKIQDMIGESCIPLLHKLEQFSSGNLVGVLAEDLLLALKQNPSSKVAAAIEEVRNQTKLEKKKLAMAKRQKHLIQLGMKANDKGQLVSSDPTSIKKMSDFSEVEEEKGHVCCICREGYKYHPQKVLAIYTFSKKVDLEHSFEAKARKSTGYSTVTHFNLVHIDCHTNAIRSARTCRDEWENAALQNANTKCNGILPIWGPDVAETVFSNALARHNNYLLEATGIRESSYVLSVHDLKMLLYKFAENLSFSESCGGGGRDSNVNLIPYMVHAVLYSINTAKYVSREERNITTFLDATEKIVSNSFECDNVFYYLAMSLIIMEPNDWKTNRFKFLNRVLITSHARLVNTPSADKQKLTSTAIQDFKKYKPSLLFIGLVDLFHKHLNAKVSFEAANSTASWTETLCTYIRKNDVVIMEACKKTLKEFEEDLMVCESLLEIFDVLGFLDDISDPADFLKTLLATYK